MNQITNFNHLEQSHRQSVRLLTFLMFLAFAVVLTPELAVAQATGGTGGAGGLLGTGSNILNALVDVMTNTWVRLIGIIAVIGVGIAWMNGRLSMGRALAVGGGLVLMFGAAAIVDSFAASV